jgi:pimeloyl-ACP methyl ester carboxylesterase
MTPEQWRSAGTELSLPDGRVFMIELGLDQPPRLPVLVLHGFPSSSWDFADIARRMAETRKVVLFDFLGFGLSDKPADAGYSLFEQAEIAIAAAAKAKLVRAHVVAHDMGTSVATELLARRERGLLPFEVASVTIMNGSVHIDLASLTAGQRLLKGPFGGAFARVAGKRVFATQMSRIFAKPAPPEVIDGMWAFITRADGNLRLPRTIRYIEERTRFRRRWIGALERIDVPVLVAWAVRDPVAVIAIGERLARETPGAKMVRWEDLGHYPQVEDPDRVARDVGQFIDACENASRP